MRASYNGFLFRRGSLLLDSFSDAETYRAWKNRSKLKEAFVAYFVRKVVRSESGIWVSDDWSSGYFHWFADVLPKIFIAKDMNLNFEIFIPGKLREKRFVKDSIKILGIENVRFIEKHTAVQFEHLFLPKHMERSGEFDERIVSTIRRKFCDYVSASRTGTRQIYLSRRLASRRRVSNEDEIREFLNRNGFEVIETDYMPLAEQIRIFSECAVLVSLHGAGLTNMLFMPQSSTVVEFRPSQGHLPDCYSNLAAAIGHKHFIVSGDLVDPSMSANIGDVYVPTERVQSALQAIGLSC